MERKRITYRSLDALRGLACLWVVLLHSEAALSAKVHLDAIPGFTPFAKHGWLGVQIFFVISGFCIAASAMHKTPKEFAKARALRICPPYFVALIIGAIVEAIAYRATQSGIAHGGVVHLDILHEGPQFWISNFLFLNFWDHTHVLLSVGWSLVYEAWFYVVMGLLLLLPLAADRSKYLWACHALTLACAIGIGFGLPFPADLWTQFGLGILLFDLLSRPQNKAVGAFAVVVCLVCLAQGLRIFSLPAYEHQHSGAAWFMVVATFVGLFLMHRIDTKISSTKLMTRLGQVGLFSYSLYLIHGIVLQPVNYVFSKLPATGLLAYILLPSMIAVCVGAGYVFYLLVESKNQNKHPGAKGQSRS